MMAALNSALRTTAHPFVIALTPLRLVAILPMTLLCAYWIFGEPALIVTALLLPAVSVFLRGSRSEDDTLPHIPSTSRLFTRDELATWLNFAMRDRSKHSGQFAVLTLAVDDIGALEARFGRGARTAIGREVARRLQGVLRQEDAVSMLEDNVIAFGLRNIRPPETENLLRLARRVQSICDEPFSQESARIYCTISIGIAGEVHVADPKPHLLIEASERACDFAKSSGAGSVRIYTEGIVSEKEEERQRTRALSDALETGEIFAWFQPQMSSDGRNVIGVEALARWDRPDFGMVQPGAFLPDIQRSGLAQRLTEVILKQALTALNAWDAAGYDVPSVSVNFSGEDLRNPRLADYIMWELDRFGLEPHRLVIEVLESVIADRHEEAITSTLSKLSRAGCRVELDDFGTGFTSIVNIRRFNVSRIKIDRCLVSRLDKDAEQRRMVSALLSFSKKLGIEALAEGVETESEREALRRLGCSHIQGYVCAKPMPLGETLIWLEDFLPQSKSEATGPTAETA